MKFVISDLFQFDLFRGLETDIFNNLHLVVTTQKFSAGQIIVDVDDPTENVFFLNEGELGAGLWTENGKEVLFSTIKAKESLGELSALDGQTRSLTVYAKTDSILTIMSKNSFLKIIDQCPAVRERVIIDLTTKIRALTLRNLEVTSFSVEKRVRSYLVNLARNEAQLKRGGEINPAPTHLEISAYIGANREEVSRTLSNLTKSGVVKASRRQIKILSPDLLRQDLY